MRSWFDKVGKGEKRKALMSAWAEDYWQAFVRAGFGMRDSFLSLKEYIW